MEIANQQAERIKREIEILNFWIEQIKQPKGVKNPNQFEKWFAHANRERIKNEGNRLQEGLN